MKTDYQIALEASQVILDRRGIKGYFELLPYAGIDRGQVVCKFKTYTIVYKSSKDEFLIDLHGAKNLLKEANEVMEQALNEHRL